MRAIKFSLLLVFVLLYNAGNTQVKEGFANKWEFVGTAVEEPGYTIWGTSPIWGNNGKVHLFVARWPCNLRVDPGWRTHSEIAHYVGDSPEGPFVFSDVAVKGDIESDKATLNNHITKELELTKAYAPHNPAIHKADSLYALFYIANNGINEHPSNQYICLSVSESLYGPWRKVGGDGLSSKIANEFKGGDKMAVIMENHGVVVGGNNIMDALNRFETMELCANAFINAKSIGEPISLSEKQLNEYKEQTSQEITYLTNASYNPVEEKTREEICAMACRAYKQGLMVGSNGNISVRGEGNYFLITSANEAHWNIVPEDIVQVKNGCVEPRKILDSSIFLHQKIYEQHPYINSIIIAHAPYLMAFNITGVKLDVSTIPEGWVFLQDIPNIPFSSRFLGNDITPKQLSKRIPALMLDNDAFLVTGNKLLQAYDRLEVAEFCAKSMVMSKSLGNLVPITKKHMEALRKKFLM